MPKQNVRSELLIGGVWTDVTPVTEGSEKVVISAGAGTESTFLTSATCRFTINNRSGLYSTDNPNSTYYGKFGRNTQFRTGLVQTKHVRMTGTYDSAGAYDNAHIGIADKASLDIVGDIDIRVDVALEDWRGSEPQFIASKYAITGDQRSWYMFIDEYGQLGFVWSSDGTSGGRIERRSVTLPASSQGRLALRVTLDVDNSGGGYTITFYTSDTIAGTWTQVSQYATTSGITSIYASTTPVNVGVLENGTVPGYVPMVGKIYGFELRNGIAGSIVAKLDPTTAARNASSVADTIAGTWFCSGSARVDDMDYRFWGEVNRLPQRWDETGRDVYAPVQAQDILSRLMSGARTLESPIYRNISRYTDPAIADGAAQAWFTGWWPMESDSGGSLSAVKGMPGNYSLANVSDWPALPGTEGGLSFSDDLGTASGNAIPQTTYYGNGGLAVAGTTFYFQLPSVPVANVTLMTWRMRSGDLARITLVAGTNAYVLAGYGPDGVLIGSTTVLYGSLPTLPTAMGFTITETGFNDFNAFMYWYPVGGTSIYTNNTLWSNAGYTKLRQIAAWTSPGFTGKSGMRLAHVTLNQGTKIDFTSYNFVQSTNAYSGEPALARFERLFQQEGVQYYTRGLSGTSPAMGPQSVDTLVNLAKECLDVVGGLLYAPRDKFGVTMRSLQGMAARSGSAPVLDYTADVLTPPLEPERISTGIKNAVVASRPGGGFRTRVKTAGPLNINDPATDPQGAGRYDSPISRNVATDYWLQSQADWEVAIGTEDSNRYASVIVRLDRPELAGTALAEKLAAMTLGDVFILRNLPIWMGTGDVELLTRGYTETIDNFTRALDLNAAPYGPYRWAAYYYAGQTGRYDSSSTTLAAGITSSATTARLALGTAQTRWSQVAVPYDVKIAGQRNTVIEVGAKGALGADLGGFETTATNWQGGTGAPVRSTAQRKHGTASGLVTVSGSPVSFTVRPTSSSVMALTTPGLDYTLSVWVYPSITLTSNFGGGITWYLGASSVSTSTATAITAPANTWTQLTFTATAPVSTDRASYGPTIAGSPANGTLVYFDAIELTGADVSFQPVVMTRGVDGVTKALSTGDQVRIFNSMTWGRI